MMANERKVSASTHNQALSAGLFLYREVLDIDLPWLNNIGRPQQTKRIPSVLTWDELASVLTHMEGTTALLARLLCGTGMRLMEGPRLGVKDVDFDRHAICGARGQGQPSPGGDVAAFIGRRSAAADADGTESVGGRQAGAARWCRYAPCFGSQISKGREHMGVVARPVSTTSIARNKYSSAQLKS